MLKNEEKSNMKNEIKETTEGATALSISNSKDLDDRPYAPRVKEPKWMDQKEYQSAPFELGDGHEEIILNAGSVELAYTDLVLPGKNGFDLRLERKYDSTKANTEDVNLIYNSKEPTRWYSIVYYGVINYREKILEETLERLEGFYNWKNANHLKAKINNSYGDRLEEHDNDGTTGDGHSYWTGNVKTEPEKQEFFMTGKRPNTHFYKKYGLGYGWRFNFPSIETIEDTPESKNSRAYYKTFLHLEDGRSFVINQNFFDGTSHDFYPKQTASKLDDYELMDVYVTKTNGCITVHYKDGRETHFDSSRQVSDMQDRFGNKIVFGYDNSGRMNRITDSYGRVILLELSENTLSVKREDTGEIECTYTLTDGQLTAFTDKVGRTTTYTYQSKVLSSCMNHDEADDDPVDITFKLLTSVLHPTGAKTEYLYSAYHQHYPAPYQGDHNFYVISGRQDYVRADDPTTVCNEVQYSYNSAEKPWPSDSTFGGNDFGVPYIYKATVLSHRDPTTGVFEHKAIHEFNTDSLNVDVKNYHIVSGVEKLVSSQNSTYINKLPQKVIDTTYNYEGQSVVKTTEYTYSTDKRGNITRQTETYASDHSCDQDVHFVYDDNYSIVTEKRSRKNNTVDIVERYKLKADSSGKPKVIEQKCIYEKSATGEELKERISFVYDVNYRIIAQHQYYGEGLETTETCITTEFVYADNVLTPNPIIHRIRDVLNADNTPFSSCFGEGIIEEHFSYDWYGRQISKTNGNGFTVTTIYDGIGRAVKEINEDATFKSVDYNDLLNTITTTDERGTSWRYEYTTLGKIARIYILEPDTLLKCYMYDYLGRMEREIKYDASAKALITTSFKYDLFDQVIEQTDLGATGELRRKSTTYERAYEGKYFHTIKTIEGDAQAPSVISKSLMDSRGRMVRETIGASVTEYTYDMLGNKTIQIDPLGSKTSWDYDYAGRIIKETNALGLSSLTNYDALGNKSFLTDRKGNITLFSYDSAGRLLLQASPFDGGVKSIVRYKYDAVGNILRREVLCNVAGEMERWRKSTYLYDNRSRIVDTILFEEDGGEIRTRFEYDSVGNKIAVYSGMLGDSLEGAAKASYFYDRFNNIIKIVDARSNALPSDDPLYLDETFIYDAVGRLINKLDRNRQTTVYSYDGLNRLIAETVTSKSVSEVVTHCYTKTDMKLSDANDTLTVKNRYDDQSRLVEQTESDGVVKSFAYDAAGNRTGFTLTRNGTAEISLGYAYDGLNRLAEVKKGEAVIARYAYDDNGNRISLEYPESGLTMAYAYNSANLVTSLVNRRGDTVVSSYRYTYYLDGNQKSKTEADGKVTDYVYDGMGRLARESEAEGNTIVYTYDRFSNRSSMTVTGSETYTTIYKYHPNNWLLTEEKREKDTVETYRYRYDGNGNQVYREWSRTGPDDGTVPRVGYVPNGFRRELATLEIRGYNGFNQMTSLYADGERTAYTYRPDGLRYGKTYGSGADATGVIHLWDGQNIVAEIGATGNVVARYLCGANLIAREQDGALQYYLHNAHGDVVQRTDALGNLLKNYRYDAYGNEENPEPLDVNPFRYCGEYFDRETGNYYLRTRFYNPQIGRFSSEDPAREGQNWYTYCKSNPVMYSDYNGLAALSVLDPTGALSRSKDNSHSKGRRAVNKDDLVSKKVLEIPDFINPLPPVEYPEYLLDERYLNMRKRMDVFQVEQYKKDFVLKIFPILFEYEKKTGIPLEIMLGQACNEASYGIDPVTEEGNNYFGVKGVGPKGSVVSGTVEYFDGEKTNIEDAFKAYNSMEESIDDYTRLLLDNYKKYTTTGTADDWANALDAGGYATYPGYGQYILGVARDWGVYK